MHPSRSSGRKFRVVPLQRARSSSSERLRRIRIWASLFRSSLSSSPSLGVVQTGLFPQPTLWLGTRFE
eukprot:1113012-Alexandrium_andersonii.AAC.1